MKDRQDRKRHIGVKYKIGEVIVMKKLPVPQCNRSAKLHPKYRIEPLQVMEVLPGDTYQVSELAVNGHKIFATTAHVSQLKSLKVLYDQNDSDDDPDMGERGSAPDACEREASRVNPIQPIQDGTLESGRKKTKPLNAKAPDINVKNIARLICLL